MAPGRPGADPTSKTKDFKGTIKRLSRWMRPERGKLSAVVLMTAAAVTATVAAPKILGNATNIVFEGVFNKQLPPGTTKEQLIAGLKAAGKTDIAKMVSALDLTPGAGIDWHALGLTLLLVIALYLVASLLNWAAGYLMRVAVQNIGYRLRDQVQRKIDRVTLTYLDRTPHGDLLSRVTNDIDNINQTLMQTLVQVLNSILSLLGMLGMMFWISWRLALLTMLVIPFAVIGGGLIMKAAKPHFSARWKTTGEVSAIVEESFTGHEVTVLYGLEEKFADEFAESNRRVTEATFKSQFYSATMMPLMSLLSNLAYVGVAVAGGYRVSQGLMSIGDVQAFIQYSRQFTQPLSDLASVANLLQSGAASAERVFEFLDSPELTPDTRSSATKVASALEINPDTPAPMPQRQDAHVTADATLSSTQVTEGLTDRSATKVASALEINPDTPAQNLREPLSPATLGTAHLDPEAHGRELAVAFRDVCFAYEPDKPVIQHLNLEVKPGQTVAIVGPTGAGKTTLVNLLMRFYEIDSGAIYLGGVNTLDIPRDELRQNIGMVLQDTWLFSGSIRQNLAFGKVGATDSEVLEAARFTSIDHIIRALPDGYDTHIDAEGQGISNGERQLLTIARAFLSDPQILILDEATSSVDTRTEVLIQEAMQKLRQGRTSFVIAHRLSTIRDADLIVVMEHGNVVEQGTHQQLMEARGAYRRLHDAQLNAGTDLDDGTATFV